MITKVILKSGKDKPVRNFHPWIFSGAVKEIIGTVAEGDVVEVFDNQNNYLATGHYQPGSILVKLFSFEQVEPSGNYWKQKMQEAIRLRSIIGLWKSEHTNIMRLIHAESDGFPGLIVDFYNGAAVMQFHSVGMYLIRQTLAEALIEVSGGLINTVYSKSKSTLPFKAPVDHNNEFLVGNELPTQVMEYQKLFTVNIEEGQKTGFYIDQRENRKLLEHYANGKTALNLFCYTGGFSVSCIKGGAASVQSVDSSKLAMALTQQNVALNFPTAHHIATECDVFDFLNNHTEKYDLIILDPPAFAKHQNVLKNALRGYRVLNQRAMERLNSGGILFTFSCSQVVSRDEFRTAVFGAATDSRKSIRILHQLTQPPDHPINIYHPESEYLKSETLF